MAAVVQHQSFLATSVSMSSSSFVGYKRSNKSPSLSSKNPTSRTPKLVARAVAVGGGGGGVEKQRRPNVVEILEERGLLESVTSESLRSFVVSDSDPNNGPSAVYCSFYPTGASLHLGNLVELMVLSWFLRCGHRVIALVEGATVRMGDDRAPPPGKKKLDPFAIENNNYGVSVKLREILSRSSSSFAVINNEDWWKHLSVYKYVMLLEKFLAERVELEKFAKEGERIITARLEEFESSVARLEESDYNVKNWFDYVSHFVFPMFQAHDFLCLYHKEGGRVQMGGPDQLANIAMGVDLIKTRIHGKSPGNSDFFGESDAYGLTFPLLLNSNGTQFGVSDSGAADIWLCHALFFPYRLYKYLYSTVSDTDVVKFLKMLTFLGMDEIAKIETDMQSPHYVPGTAQTILAEEVTRIIHGQEGLDFALYTIELVGPDEQNSGLWLARWRCTVWN